VRKYGQGCDVFVTPVSVAAFLTPEMIAGYLKKAGIKSEDYDLILIPGLVRGSAQVVEDELGIPAFKGPRNAMDIPQTLKAVENGFKTTFKFLLDLKDRVLSRNGRMIVWIDPEALEPNQLKMLEREFGKIS